MAGKTPLEIIKGVRELLSAPERWTKRVWARDVDHRPIPIIHPDAVCFCINGAITKVSYFDSDADTRATAREAIANHLPPTSYSPSSTIHVFNDATTTTHEMVLKLLDQVIGSSDVQT